MKVEYRFTPDQEQSFKPTKSSKPGREFVPSEPGGRHSKFGFCQYLKKWVRRDNMLGINARFYNADGDQKTVRMRVSEEGWNAILNIASEAAWDNELKTRSELVRDGLEFDDHYESSDD